jgi:N-acetylglutamate synthase-like GNAT family acetyltransferase
MRDSICQTRYVVSKRRRGRLRMCPRQLRAACHDHADAFPRELRTEVPAVNSASQPAEPRQATEADLPSIQCLIAAAYGKYLSRMDKPPAPLLRDYRPAIENGAIWLEGSPVIGLISLSQADDVILIENVAVHPDQQGSGVGRRLMEFAEQYARNRQIRRLALYTNEVMTENQAIYTHLGYQVTSRRTDDGYRRIYMEKNLPASEAARPSKSHDAIA